MEEAKLEVIKIFENKSDNFKKRMKREFRKVETNNINLEQYKYREILLYDLFKELTNSNDRLLDNIEQPIDFIEETLFNYIISE